jgi:hypothetical protein
MEKFHNFSDLALTFRTRVLAPDINIELSAGISFTNLFLDPGGVANPLVAHVIKTSNEQKNC